MNHIPPSSSPDPKRTYPTASTSRRTSRNGPGVVAARIEKSSRELPKGLIRLFVNNRLGSRYEILCSPSDSIGDFKKIVAVYSGMRPEAILLKRQGMRPLKDVLTLEDYEIGDGSSLDLETDTSD